MATQVKAKYRGTQLAFYSIGETGWNNCKRRIAAFALKKAKYTIAFVDGKLAAIAAAKALPDEEQRNQFSEEDRVQLIPLRDDCAQNFLDVKGYIRDAFLPAEWKGKYEAAGGTKYEKAVADNWEFVDGMNEEMEAFISANSAVLTTPGGMPAGFAADVASDSDDYADKYLELKTSRQTGSSTAAKLTANNDCHDDLMEMFKDAVEMVYHKDAEAQKEFTYQVIKNIVSPPGAAGLDVKVLLPDNSLSAEGKVTIVNEGGVPKIVLLSAGNPAPFNSIDSDKWDVKVEVPGFPTVNVTKEVNVGVRARVTVKVGV